MSHYAGNVIRTRRLDSRIENKTGEGRNDILNGETAKVNKVKDPSDVFPVSCFWIPALYF
jgi:hypothetical protein